MLHAVSQKMQNTKEVLIAAIEARKDSCDDKGYIDLRYRRSLDGGNTWTPARNIDGAYNKKGQGFGNSSFGDVNMIEDKDTGRIWLTHTRNNTYLYMSYSDDAGESWSEPVLRQDLHRGWPSQQWIGSGHSGGIQLQLSGGGSAGSQSHLQGRLLIPVYSNAPYPLISDDHGATWRMGGAVDKHRGQAPQSM